MDRPLIFLGSPRKGGNSDTAGLRFAAGATQSAQGVKPEIIALRDYRLLPCTGCGACAKGKDCALAQKDDAAGLHEKLMRAPWAAFAAPIYFYHLPAHFKAFIDRSQALWEQRVAQERKHPGTSSLSTRPAFALLAGARGKGDQLFTGSLLTLKYFLWTFHMRVADSRVFYSMDGPADLAGNGSAMQSSWELGQSVSTFVHTPEA